MTILPQLWNQDQVPGDRKMIDLMFFLDQLFDQLEHLLARDPELGASAS